MTVEKKFNGKKSQLLNLSYLIICFLILSCKTYSQVTHIAQAEAIKITNTKAKSLGYSPEKLKMRIEKTIYNIDSLKQNYPYFRVKPLSDFRKKTLKILSLHHFWFVYYTQKDSAFGWDLSIFVDSKNGKILTYILGE